MKKFFAAAALSLAALLLFAGCSAQVTVDISSGWLTSPTTNYDQNFYESLDYSVKFANSDTEEHLTIEIDPDNSSYNITTEARSTYTLPDGSATYTSVYHLTATLKVSATYTYTAEGRDPLVFSFGGSEDADPDTFEAEDADTVVMEVWFTSPQSTVSGTETPPPAFSPIRSVQTSKTHGAATSVSGDTTVFVSMYDFSVEKIYDRACENVTLTYTDNFADLTEEERAAGDYASKESTRFEKSTSVGDLQKRYTCVDNAQLFFLTRGLAMNTDTSHTLTVVSGIGNNYATIRISCSEPVNSRVTFTMIDSNGVADAYENEEIPVVQMSFTLADSGSNVGEGTTVTYAQRASEGTNTNRCLPLSIETPYGFSVGNYVYTLETASYQRPAGQA